MNEWENYWNINPVGLKIGGYGSCEEALNKGNSRADRKVKMGTGNT